MGKLKVSVHYQDQYTSSCAELEIPDIYHQAFESLKVCDDSIIAMATGEYLANSDTVQIVIKRRKDAAKILAKELTQFLLEAMEKQDTYNGYSKSEQGQPRC